MDPMKRTISSTIQDAMLSSLAGQLTDALHLKDGDVEVTQVTDLVTQIRVRNRGIRYFAVQVREQY